MTERSFRYADLFAGIGGFAAALEGLGGHCAYSVELDKAAALVYARNWGHVPRGARADQAVTGDITEDANDLDVRVPEHDILVAGFPCQPFSKSGSQRGMGDETRGTLFHNIVKVIEARRPALVLLENVRNLAGPRHEHEWKVILASLRRMGYRVPDRPCVVSPHRLSHDYGGRPQVRERVFITATYDPDGSAGQVDIPDLEFALRVGDEWDLTADLPLDEDPDPETRLSEDELRWIEAWNDFVVTMWAETRRALGPKAKLPGFPIWTDQWTTPDELDRWRRGGPRPTYTDVRRVPEDWAEIPVWKQRLLSKNADFYGSYKTTLDQWMKRHSVKSFPRSARKFEWQAQQTQTLWECAIQARPSGIRAKRPTHLPALVAITQTPILGPKRRHLSTREAARLQGLPDNFSFGEQSAPETFRQLGNGVNVGVVWNVLRAHVRRDADALSRTPGGRAIISAIERAPIDPTPVVQSVLDHQRAKRDSSEMRPPGASRSTDPALPSDWCRQTPSPEDLS